MEELDGTPLKLKKSVCYVKKFYSRGTAKAKDVKPASAGSGFFQISSKQSGSGYGSLEEGRRLPRRNADNYEHE